MFVDRPVGCSWNRWSDHRGARTSGVAHDFNNFLTVILGNLELIQQDTACNSDLRKRAEHALLATERGADLTRRLLAFSRNQSLEPRLMDVNECVTQMKMLLGSVLWDGMTVKTDLAPDLPPIMADPGQFETAVLNLALNARDAMPSGGVISMATSLVTLDADQTSGKWSVAKGQHVVITVDDTGEGMSPKVQDRLLEPFFTTKPSGKGSGLGFPMAYKFVKEAGGHVVVRSQVGHGTSVALYFPAAEPATQPAPGPFAAAPGLGGNETILLVENDVAVRDLLNDLLTRLGYRVLLASRASEAHEVLAGGMQVDLLVTDIILAGERSGIKLANEVRETRPTAPVLVMANFADSTITGTLSGPAAAGWLAKPFSSQTVARRVRELLDA